VRPLTISIGAGGGKQVELGARKRTEKITFLSDGEGGKVSARALGLLALTTAVCASLCLIGTGNLIKIHTSLKKNGRCFFYIVHIKIELHERKNYKEKKLYGSVDRQNSICIR
jgi:hypothetical protein